MTTTRTVKCFSCENDVYVLISVKGDDNKTHRYCWGCAKTISEKTGQRIVPFDDLMHETTYYPSKLTLEEHRKKVEKFLNRANERKTR